MPTCSYDLSFVSIPASISISLNPLLFPLGSDDLFFFFFNPHSFPLIYTKNKCLDCSIFLNLPDPATVNKGIDAIFRGTSKLISKRIAWHSPMISYPVYRLGWKQRWSP